MTERLTQNRSAVYNIVAQFKKPVHAQSIFEALSPSLDRATVYRALEYLERNHYVEGFTFPCVQEGTRRYFIIKGKNHMHYFHCEQCHGFFPYDECSLANDIKRFEKQSGNIVHDHTMYLTGVCRECQKPLTFLK
jgi:Fur family ferric uptake transcriptional regulator